MAKSGYNWVHDAIERLGGSMEAAQRLGCTRQLCAWWKINGLRSSGAATVWTLSQLSGIPMSRLLSWPPPPAGHHAPSNGRVKRKSKKRVRPTPRKRAPAPAKVEAAPKVEEPVTAG
jgi:hypothetical protein